MQLVAYGIGISTLPVTRKSLFSRLSTADTPTFSMEAIEQTWNGTSLEAQPQVDAARQLFQETVI